MHLRTEKERVRPLLPTRDFARGNRRGGGEAPQIGESQNRAGKGQARQARPGKRGHYSAMAPSTPTIALTLAFGIGGRSGESFYLQNPSNSAASSRRRPRPATVVVAKAPTAGLATQGEASNGVGGDSNGSSRYEDVLGQRTPGTESTFFFMRRDSVNMLTFTPSVV